MAHNPEQSDKLIVIAKIAGVYGIKGQLKIHSFTEPKLGFLDYKSLYWNYNNQWQPLPAVKNSIKKLGQNIILNIENCTDRDQAKSYQFVEIAVKRSDFQDLDDKQYYWTDLYGLDVYTVYENADKPKYLGVIDHLLETGANDVVVVKNPNENNKQCLIPYVLDQFIISIDLKQRKMVVNWDPDF